MPERIPAANFAHPTQRIASILSQQSHNRSKTDMKLNIRFVIPALAIAALLPGCNKGKADDELAHHHHEHAEASPEGHSEEIVLHEHEAERFGVKSDTIRPGEFFETIEASGRVMPSPADNSIVSAPTSGTVRFAQGINAGVKVAKGALIATVDPATASGGNPDRAAKAALDAAKRELDRLTPLYKDRLVTASDYNAALAAYEQAKAGYSATALSGRATAPVGGTITAINAAQGQYVEAGTPIATISSTRNLALRIDVPQKYFAAVPSLDNARVKFAYSPEAIDIASLGGKRLTGDAVPASGTSGAYIPVYFSITNDGSIVPESYFTAYLLGKRREGVISVPKTALSEQQGNFYVYQRLDEDCYRKKPVRTGSSDGINVEILSGIEPGDVIVTEGTTTVRLAEGASVMPEGHSHNH